MGAEVNWANPYEDREGRWYKGDIHVHCTAGSGCATMSWQEAIDAYVSCGFDFLSFSDHFVLTEIQDDRLVLIPGMEWTGMDRRHTGIYSPQVELIEQVRRTTEQEDALEMLAGRNALTMVAHPSWKNWDHYTPEALDAAGPFDAMEIYNATGEGSPGAAEAADRWDYVLSGGRRVLGVAASDAHRTERVGTAWIALRAPGRTLGAIFAALRRGNFYASSGVALTDIRREGSRILVEAEDAEEFQVIGTMGRRLHVAAGGRLEFDTAQIPADSEIGYVRVEAYGYGSAKAWTQPFFLDA